MSARLLSTDLPRDAQSLSVGSVSVFATCGSGRVAAIDRANGRVRTLATPCRGGNVVGDERDTYVVDVGSKIIWHDRETESEKVVEGLRLSSVGLLAGEHLYFTTTDALYRVPRGRGDVEGLVRGEEPALLGAFDGRVVFTLGSFFAPSNDAFAIPFDGGKAQRIDAPAVPPGCLGLAADRLLCLDGNHQLSAVDLATGTREALVDLKTVAEYARYRPRPFLHADAASIYFSGAAEDDSDLQCRWVLSTQTVESYAIPSGVDVEHTAASPYGVGFYMLVDTRSEKHLVGWNGDD